LCRDESVPARWNLEKESVIKREDLIPMMVKMLQAALNEQTTGGEPVTAQADSALVGGQAVVTSMTLVAFVTDVESTLASDFNLEVTLVSEKALSRKNSPFRSIESLADYIMELAETPVAN
jgi:hypothetical protein